MKKIKSIQCDEAPTTDMRSSAISKWTTEARQRGRVEETESEIRFVGKWEIAVAYKAPKETQYGPVWMVDVFLCDTKNFA